MAKFSNGRTSPERFDSGKYEVFGSNGIIGLSDEINSDANTIIIGRVGSYCGSLYFSKKECWVTDNAIKANAKENSDPFYLYYLLVTQNLNSKAAGSGQPLINQEILNSIEIILPPLPEQKAIAAILSSFDDKIELLRRQNKTLEAIAEIIFRKWFIEDVGGRWKTTTLSEHTIVLRGLSYKGDGLTDESSGIPMHNLNSIYEGGGYKYEGIKYYNGEYKERHIVKAGDIIVANTEQGHEFRLIGFPAIVPDCFGDAGIFSQHIYKLNILEQSYLTSQFIYYLIMMFKVREQIIGATNGTTVNMLAIDGLQRPEFNLPPKEIILKFSEIIQGYWKKQNVNHKQIQTLSKLRDALLPKLMRGEIRVKYTE